MPTAARLFAAIAYAAVAFFASESFKPLLPDGFPTGRLSEINAVIGLLTGWMVMGRLAGQGYGAAINNGIRTTAVMVFYILFAQSSYQMIKLSMRNTYDGPMDAVIGIFDQAWKYGSLMVGSVEVMAILIVGGILAAWFSEWAAQRWN